MIEFYVSNKTQINMQKGYVLIGFLYKTEKKWHYRSYKNLLVGNDLIEIGNKLNELNSHL